MISVLHNILKFKLTTLHFSSDDILLTKKYAIGIFQQEFKVSNIIIRPSLAFKSPS